jgi:hypothetical protein
VKPGRHKISYLTDKINQLIKEQHKISNKSASRGSILAEISVESVLMKLFTDTEITFNF